jgi:hypothetical protein
MVLALMFIIVTSYFYSKLEKIANLGLRLFRHKIFSRKCFSHFWVFGATEITIKPKIFSVRPKKIL